MRIALCLSGGGLRATFYHLGVLRFLRDVGLLRRESLPIVSAVSGGSIVAAHLIKNWDAYKTPDVPADGPESDDLFERAALELIEFCDRDLRNRTARRTPKVLPGMRRLFGNLDSNARLLEAEYAELFRRQPIVGEQRENPDIIFESYKTSNPPTLLINSSSLSSGSIVSISESEILVHGFDRDQRTEPHRERETKARFSFAVAASSAFPLMFSPLPVIEEDFPMAFRELRPKGFDRELLIDGGVYDNFGLRALEPHLTGVRRDGNLERVEIDLVVVSNAGAEFEWRSPDEMLSKIPGLHFLQRIARSSDIMSRRLRDLELSVKVAPGTIGDHTRLRLLEIASTTPDHPIKSVIPTEDPESSKRWNPVQEHWQKQLAGVRTDLDRFDKGLIAMLIMHGYCVARRELWLAPDNPLELRKGGDEDFSRKVSEAWCPKMLRDEFEQELTRRCPTKAGDKKDKNYYFLRWIQSQSERRFVLPILNSHRDHLAHLYQLAALVVVLIFAVVSVTFGSVWITGFQPFQAVFKTAPTKTLGFWDYSMKASNGEVASGVVLITGRHLQTKVMGVRTNRETLITTTVQSNSNSLDFTGTPGMQSFKTNTQSFETNATLLPWEARWALASGRDLGSIVNLSYQYDYPDTRMGEDKSSQTSEFRSGIVVISFNLSSITVSQADGHYIRKGAKPEVGTITLKRNPAGVPDLVAKEFSSKHGVDIRAH